MKNSSDMAHQGLIDFELAQKILDGTKGSIKETIDYLEKYLGLNLNENYSVDGSET